MRFAFILKLANAIAKELCLNEDQKDRILQILMDFLHSKNREE